MPPLTKQTWTARREGLPFGRRRLPFRQGFTWNTRASDLTGRHALRYRRRPGSGVAEVGHPAKPRDRRRSGHRFPQPRPAHVGDPSPLRPQTDVARGGRAPGIQDGDTRLDRTRRHSTRLTPPAESANICSLAGRCSRGDARGTDGQAASELEWSLLREIPPRQGPRVDGR